ncbi:SNF2 family N-terminal domain-containing protein [Massariosphaeria phaeospora]|uniref:SNF2 family N-terminal domain-containing protein n=1 Tax=Massariosphaeria phaeospora TaxID=100035 RepID=A0A7C8I5P5_9PLEO|nr:SNF2 family N-terminal domain-containing protein [Massariosphaeria phaeospora]
MDVPEHRGAKRQRLCKDPVTSNHEPAGFQRSNPMALSNIVIAPCHASMESTEPATEPLSALIAPGAREDDWSPADEMVCFGTIPGIAGKFRLDSSQRFTSVDCTGTHGLILPHHGQMVQGLLEERTLQLHASCSPDTEPTNRRQLVSYAQLPCTLEITVYGPLELFEQIGDWFQEYDVYLQDPRECHLNVKYCNPQRLSSDDLGAMPKVSEVVSNASSLIHFHDVVERPDLLEIISSQDHLEEAEQPALLRAALHKHQKQALTFMLRRESGWTLADKGSDIWEASDSSRGRLQVDSLYINRITDVHQADAPPQFYGGIIADPMGLGKTLTMIALAAADPGSNRAVNDHSWDMEEGSNRPVSATLIIVPQPLLGTWEEQLSEHVVAGGLKFSRHHGKTRLDDIDEINAVDLVLTTYHTLSADWKTWKAKENHVMFSVQWRRIILDEAHVIRNMKSRMARAICELDAISRWAVTGTPIQNNLSDLTALLKFIRVYPYDEPKRFETDISRLWKSGEDEEAVKRLKRLSSCLILRRAKRTIDLPPRRDVKCPVDFSKSERALYDTIRQQTITKIDDALLHQSELSTSGAYVNFLQQIESMRLVCNLGLHYHSRHEKLATQDTADWKTTAQETFNIQREMEPVICSQCSSPLDLAENFLDESLTQDSPQFSRCMKYACSECSHKLRITRQKMVCGHTPRCPIAPVSISNSASEETPGHISHKRASTIELPSKVEVLIADLKALPPDVKCIVFSTWRLTLDIVDAGLTQAGFRSVRFDGKVPQTQRQPVLNQFKSDPGIRVMLLTLSCGAVGLTLTEASRAYLMEPHWNPTIEEQALARIHRIGQKRPVTTIRFYMRDSFEERVMEVQESKKNLAGVLLSGHDGGHADDSLGALQRLRSLL